MEEASALPLCILRLSPMGGRRRVWPTIAPHLSLSRVRARSRPHEANLAPRLSSNLLRAQVGLSHFEVRPSTFEETLDKAAFPSGAAYAVATARAKAAEVAAAVRAGMGASPTSHALVLAADTVVQAPDGTILEKPDDDAHAVRMLTSLAGGTHTVHTGCSLVVLPPPLAEQGGEGAPPPSQQQQQQQRATFIEFSETTAVTFAPLSPGEIAAYVATGEAAGKAGGYGIQGAAGVWVSRLDGCYFNVVGLPLHALGREVAGLVEAGVIGLK